MIIAGLWSTKASGRERSANETFHHRSTAVSSILGDLMASTCLARLPAKVLSPYFFFFLL
jgi:hypothetical protein